MWSISRAGKSRNNTQPLTARTTSQVGLRPLPDAAPARVEGVILKQDTSFRISGCYVNYKVKCPAHEICTLSRSQSLCGNFGPAEPWGYLGCWLKASRNYSSKALHKEFVPSPEQVREYLVSLGYHVP